MTTTFLPVFKTNVKLLYGVRGKDVGDVIITEWLRVLDKYDDQTLMRGFNAMRESADDFPNPGKMKSKIDAMLPVKSVDALPLPEAPAIEYKAAPGGKCECGRPTVNFGYTPIRCCASCLMKIVRMPRAERIAAGRAVGIPVKDDGRVDV